ncbi:MAG: hypothetical protein WC873_00640 [Candidatus Gracilibacteria bacterium]
MKKLLTKIAIVFFLGLTLATPLTQIAVAADPTSETNLPDIPRPVTLPGPDSKDFSGTEDDANKRQVFITDLLPRYTVVLVGVLGVFAFLYLVIAGVRFLTAYGNDEAYTKAKNQATYAVVAFLIAILSYIIVSLVVNIDFIQPPSGPTGFTEMTAYAEAPDINELTPRYSPEWGGGNETDLVAKLPDATLAQIITAIVITILKLSMVLATIAIVVAGIFYLISQGNDDQTKKAKDIVIYLLIGMAIIAASYGLIVGIAQFKFLE